MFQFPSTHKQFVGFIYREGVYWVKKTANNFLCVVSFKHRLLQSPEFQKGPGDKFLLQVISLDDDSHDAKVVLHSYLTMKQESKGNKWRQEHKSPLYSSSFFSHLPEGAAIPSCAVPENTIVL